MRRITLTFLALPVALLAVACGGATDDDDAPAAGDDATSSATVEPASGTVEPSSTISGTTAPDPTQTAPGSDSGSGTAAAAATSLEITIWAEGKDAGNPAQLTLQCDPDGGTVPDPAAACAALSPDLFAPIAGDMACTEIYGGPVEATVVGTLDGTPVNAEFSRENGCEIARFEKAAALLPGSFGPEALVPETVSTS